MGMSKKDVDARHQAGHGDHLEIKSLHFFAGLRDEAAA
jgi:hypothetical protein